MLGTNLSHKLIVLLINNSNMEPDDGLHSYIQGINISCRNKFTGLPEEKILSFLRDLCKTEEEDNFRLYSTLYDDLQATLYFM